MNIIFIPSFLSDMGNHSKSKYRGGRFRQIQSAPPSLFHVAYFSLGNTDIGTPVVVYLDHDGAITDTHSNKTRAPVARRKVQVSVILS